MTKQVLEGIKVLDFGATGTGPLTVQHLGQLGATVVEVESAAHMDILRTIPPFADNIPGVNRSGFFTECNVNKYGLALNISMPQGLEIVKKLVAWADIIEENWAPGVMNRLGLGYETLKEINPGIIMIGMTIQGQTGPHAKHPGYGMMLSSLTGVTALCGFPDEGIAGTYGAYPDFIAPRHGAIALLAALDYRRRTGKGQYIDAAQLESQPQLMLPLILDYTVNKRVAKKMGNRSPYAAPHGAYRCLGDDRWCAIAVTTDEEWEAFCEVIGNPAWTEEPRFATLLGRKQNEDELDKLIEEWTADYSAEEVMTLMQAYGVPAGVCQNAQDLWEDPQLRHRGYNVMLEHAEVGRRAYTGIRFILSKTPGELTMAAPIMGQHNDYVCTQLLGMSDEEFVELLATGVFE